MVVQCLNMFLIIVCCSACDGGIFQHCTLRRAIEDGTITFPPPAPLPGDDSDVPIPYALVGDDAFPLRSWLMKPLSLRQMGDEARIFNYRLSRARRVVENAFGILSQRFRCLRNVMEQHPDNVTKIVQACCVLHNILRTKYPTMNNRLVDSENPVTHCVLPGAWRDEAALTAIQSLRGNNASKRAKAQREYLKKFYNGPGSVPWQDKMI